MCSGDFVIFSTSRNFAAVAGSSAAARNILFKPECASDFTPGEPSSTGGIVISLTFVNHHGVRSMRPTRR